MDNFETPLQLRIYGDLGLSLDEPEFTWIDAPSSFWIIQPSLKVRPSDHGKFALLTHLSNGFIGWMTPLTASDNTYWINGLDGCEYLHECIALFDDREAAGFAIWRRSRRGSSLFTVDVGANEIRLIFVESEVRAVA